MERARWRRACSALPHVRMSSESCGKAKATSIVFVCSQIFLVRSKEFTVTGRDILTAINNDHPPMPKAMTFTGTRPVQVDRFGSFGLV